MVIARGVPQGAYDPGRHVRHPGLGRRVGMGVVHIGADEQQPERPQRGLGAAGRDARFEVAGALQDVRAASPR
jgi:hypothetical protein